MNGGGDSDSGSISFILSSLYSWDVWLNFIRRSIRGVCDSESVSESESSELSPWTDSGRIVLKSYGALVVWAPTAWSSRKGGLGAIKFYSWPLSSCSNADV
jgi:hypothetical protein